MQNSVARLCALSLVALATNAAAVTIETVPVGFAGNAPDQDYSPAHDPIGPQGAVPYAFRMGTYEVTNAQFAEFLNAKKIGWTSLMSPDSFGRGGIHRMGVGPNSSYTVEPGFADKPVVGMTAYTAMRFANWMNNGQGDADTETGAYTLPFVPGTSTVPRNPGATWFLPNEDEWYKAAYYQPAALGGDTDDYWLYPTRSNTAPTEATADANGNISNPGPNVINYNQGADWNGANGNVTTVGSAGPQSTSFFGTYDQGGNVREWTEGARFITDSFNARGGSFIDNVGYPPASFRGFFGPSRFVGFRLAAVATIPEPSTIAMAAMGLLALVGVTVRRTAVSKI